MDDDVLDGDDSSSNVLGGDVLGADDLGGGDSGSDVLGGDVLCGDDLGGDDSGSDVLGDDVIIISDDEDNENCIDLTEFHQTEKTQIVTLTYKRKIKYVNGAQIIENFGCAVHREDF